MDEMTPLELSNIFAKYYAEDFTVNVMRHLGGSYPLDDGQLKQFIISKVDQLFTKGVSVTNGNAITRFIYECAKHAIDVNYPDKTSYLAWKNITALPSVHHDELNSLVYESASLYNDVINGTLLGVVAKDADIAAKSIQQAVSNRTANVETGGSLNVFNWGILNDGIWLNGALMKAFDVARIFRPGDKVIAYYSTTAFEFARQFIVKGMLDNNAQAVAYGQLDVVFSQMEHPDASVYAEVVTQSDLNTLLFEEGAVQRAVSAWQLGLTHVEFLVKSVNYLSSLVRLLNIIIDTQRGMEDDTLISDDVMNRVYKLLDVATMVLVAFEALRETKFQETLIMQVSGEGDDPKVEVLINGDLINGYHSAGGDDSDLIRFGHFLDPRTGKPKESNGWSMDYVISRRDKVVPEMIAKDADRLEKLRRNDANFIAAATTKIVGDVVSSYVTASTLDVAPRTTERAIYDLGRKISDPNQSINLDAEIISILAPVTNNQMVVDTAARLTNLASHQDDYLRDNAVAFTIAETAINDVVSYISDDQI